MKNFLKKNSVLLLLLFSAVTYSQSVKIITSKEEAQKKGIYNSENAIASNEPKTKKEKAKEKKEAKKKQKRLKKALASLNNKNAKDIFIEKKETNYLAEQIVNNTVDNLGVTYSYGGTSKNGFDCSGLLYITFKKFEIDIPRSSSNMADLGKTIKPSKAEKGDLIFFATSGGNQITHVGIITEVNGNEILFVHASTSSGVIISSLSEKYYQKSFVQINRILEN